MACRSVTLLRPWAGRRRAVSAIVRGVKAIDAKTAIELEQALGIAASFWLRLEAQYRLALARQEVA